jgi:6-phosphofructokinase
MAGAAVVVQCGGPTAVFNAQLAGVLRACRAARAFESLLGARYGLRGLESGDFVELEGCDDRRLESQAGAFLGSGRDSLADEALDAALAQLELRGASTLFLIGGNGSMKAARALSRRGAALRVIAIPKTIDNDIAETDVSPGYGSAARFLAASVRDAGLDLCSMRGFDDVAVVETMGRSAGWLAAATALARHDAAAPPHLVLVPEVPLDDERFLAAVRRQHERDRICIVACAEGVRGTDGAFVAERTHPLDIDPSGQKLLGIMGGPAPALARLVRDHLGLRCRQMRPDVIQRSSTSLASEVDLRLALPVGTDAVQAALDGCSGVMIALERCDSSRWKSVPVPLERVAGRDRAVPVEFLDPDRFDVTPAFVEYARPLIGDGVA